MSETKDNSITSRQQQAIESRKKLLIAAKKLFSEKGYKGTTVRSINQSVDMADGILYHYFPGGKKEIFSAVLDESFSENFRQLDNFNDDIESLPLKIVLDTLYKKVNDTFVRDIDLIKILIKENQIIESENKDKLSTLFKNRLSWFADFLERRYEEGEIRKMDFTMAATHFMTMSVMNIFAKSTGIQLTEDFSKDVYREQLINYTLDLWISNDDE